MPVVPFAPSQAPTQVVAPPDPVYIAMAAALTKKDVDASDKKSNPVPAGR